ncbi:hypothetical protein TFLX_03196 [Thermoflexales bacterium]|nr:hypothetical protein TFLX_03196 [Thermoflexales bacterium]
MIVVNGKSYASLDEMPPEVRHEYQQAMGILADKNQNGLPDVFEGLLETGNVNVQTSTVLGSTQFIVDGKVYSNVNELPPEAWQKFEQALGKMGPALEPMMGDADQNNMPDIFDGMFAAQPAPSTPPATSTSTTAPSRPLFEATPTDNNDATPNNRGTLMFAGIVIVALLVALLVLGASGVLPMIK